jgi:hypothetical protein
MSRTCDDDDDDVINIITLLPACLPACLLEGIGSSLCLTPVPTLRLVVMFLCLLIQQ